MTLKQGWLPEAIVPEKIQLPVQAALWELDQQNIQCSLTVDEAMGDAFEILDGGKVIRGGQTGILYGTYRLLEGLRTGGKLPQGMQTPAYSLRMINHWDNMNGDVERGYAGKSIFFAND